MPTPSVDNMEGRKVFKDLDITKDEADRIAKAFENEEFRKLFKEYAEEISDPENRKRYEEEIAILEGEKGMDVKFVNPTPGYVIKTTQNGDTKVFINICKNEHIAKPTATKKTDDKGKSGLAWQIPHSFSPPREDMDKAQNKCMVYDVVFNPDTYRMAETNVHFKKMIQDTALDGIEGQFGVKLDKKNIKVPKIQFKGVARPTVIRSKKGEGSKKLDADDPLNKMPYPYDDVPSDVKAKNNEEQNKNKKNAAQNEKASKEENYDYTTPKFSVTHRNELDFQDFTGGGPRKCDTSPKELVVSIDLPLLNSSKNVNLNIFEKKLVLQSEKPAKYKLDLDLPYTVNDDTGSAKFDKAKRKLVVTLPVVKTMADIQQDSQEIHNTPLIAEHEVSAEDPTTPYDGEAKPAIEVNQEPEKDTDSTMNEDGQVNSSNSNNGSCDGDMNIPKKQDDHIEDLTSEISEYNVGKVGGGQPLTDDAKSAEKVYYAEPPCDFHQDESTVSIVMKVSNVQEDSLSKFYPGEAGSAFGLKFVSLGMGSFPMHYSLILRAPEGVRFKAAASHVDVDDALVVMLLSKDRASHGLWDKIFIGKDEASLQEKFFVTDSTLRSDLNDLEAAAAMPSPDNSPDLLVTDMNENKLAITIKSKKDSESPPDSPPEPSSDFQMGQEQKGSSKLQSILKQRSRTVSESSDEVFTYSRENSLCLAGSESPISESEEGGDGEPGRRVRTKSVSFSEKVDQQTFKQNQPTTSLRNTLKNKRKNQRKAERKHQEKAERGGRRNRSSDSISEMSSDGEGSSTHDEVSSNHEDNDNSEKNEDVVDNKNVHNSGTTTTVISDANGNITTPNENATSANDVMNNQQKNKKNSKRKNRRNKKQAGKGDEVASDGHQPPETSSPSSQSEDGEGRGVDARHCCDSEKVVPKKKLVEIVKDDGHDSDDSAGEDDNSPEDGERTKNLKNDTILNWEEGTKAAEERAQCPVSFSNSVMFDLD